MGVSATSPVMQPHAALSTVAYCNLIDKSRRFTQFLYLKTNQLRSVMGNVIAVCLLTYVVLQVIEMMERVIGAKRGFGLNRRESRGQLSCNIYRCVRNQQ